MNHQIKGYLTIDKSIFSELLTDDYGCIPEAAKGLIVKGADSTNKGVRYVTDILRGASAESGTLTYDMQKIDFRQIVLSVIESQKKSIEEKKLKLIVDILDGNYNTIGDGTQLGEAIRNIIENSINYTPVGSISVHLRRVSQKIIFSVNDTGVGIRDEDKPQIFRAGGIGRDSVKINVNSSGYGLAFVKGVVEKHGGQVWFESTSGIGSNFFVELPVK